ncbi:lytic transglycosylase domain-containing protein [Longimicrobium terrae]|uniref:Soluble lytic murein transglycosylase-like protein n=1 Tax=Longimicrobium terrae TaxID=1639882 RepID=A0A841GXV5_9BACT|nr:lytic transglycosylase domain-containing protein [Longimicrobium terrae]MBB6070585.1 soluble lytic murein transglycosylase-like protein [Longimicrobium terrae]NNC29569.1 lytic transglycosylase domain-containing protein [Longimicrobium terrae]
MTSRPVSVSNNESRNKPVKPGATELRNDFRSLIRSRAVQALLLGTAAVQAAVGFTGGAHDNDGKLHRGVLQNAVREGVALRLAPNVVSAPARLAAATGAADGSPALALADEYRAQGYQIPDELASKIYTAAVENELPPELAFGLVRTESEFKDYATSHVGAIGLTQLMLPTAKWFKKGVTEDDLRDSDTNLRIGFRYLGELIDRYHGDVELALTAYNRGTGTVDRVLAKGGDPDNGYAGKVLGRGTE